MKKFEFNLLTLDDDVITLDDLISNMDGYDSGNSEAANDDYYNDLTTSTDVIN